MGTPEGKVKTFIDTRMKTWFPAAFKYSPPGLGRFGKNGMPDRLWFIRATSTVCIPVAIEAKALGEKPTLLQTRTLERLRDLGVLAAVVIGKDEQRMEMIYNEILRRIRLANTETA